MKILCFGYGLIEGAAGCGLFSYLGEPLAHECVNLRASGDPTAERRYCSLTSSAAFASGRPFDSYSRCPYNPSRIRNARAGLSRTGVAHSVRVRLGRHQWDNCSCRRTGKRFLRDGHRVGIGGEAQVFPGT